MLTELEIRQLIADIEAIHKRIETAGATLAVRQDIGTALYHMTLVNDALVRLRRHLAFKLIGHYQSASITTPGRKKKKQA